MVSHERFSPVSRAIIGAVFTFAIVVAPASGIEGVKKFYRDDPLLQEPAPLPVKHVEKRDVDDESLDNSFEVPCPEGKVARRGPHPALDINTWRRSRQPLVHQPAFLSPDVERRTEARAGERYTAQPNWFLASDLGQD